MLQKIGLYLKYILRNNFSKWGPVCSKTVAERHLCILWPEISFSFTTLETINVTTSIDISYKWSCHNDHFEYKFNSVQ